MTEKHMDAQQQSDKSPEKLDLANRIRAWREAAGLRKIELARALSIDPSMVSKWEKADTSPGIENQHRIASACKISITEFWGKLPEAVGDA